MKKKPVIRTGEVKTVNAVATFHKILDRIANNGKLECQTNCSDTEATYVFMSNGVCATLHIQSFNPQLEGGLG